MSALTVEPGPGPGQDRDDLVRIREETDAPEGCKVEIIEEIVTVSPPPSKDHNTTAALLQRRLYTVIPEDWGDLPDPRPLATGTGRDLHP